MRWFTFSAPHVQHFDIITDAIEHQERPIGNHLPPNARGKPVGRRDLRMVAKGSDRTLNACQHRASQLGAADLAVIRVAIE